MKTSPLLSLVSIALVAGCAAPQPRTPAQQAAHDKQIAKLEARAWNLGGFLANVAGKVVTTTVSNYAEEYINRNQPLPHTRGFSK